MATGALVTELTPQAKPLAKSFDAMVTETFRREGLTGDDVWSSLEKSISTGLFGFPSGSGNSSPLRLENLDSTMTSVLFGEDHLRIFASLHKQPSINGYYEWNRRVGYGTSRGSAGFAEGQAPLGGTAAFQRSGAYIKYLGVRRGVTHQVALPGQLGGMQIDPVAEENHDGTMQLLQMIERQVLHGDASVLDQSGNPSGYDGFYTQLWNSPQRTTNIIDLAGAPLSYDSLGNAAFNLYQRGKITNFSNIKMFMSGQTLEDLGKYRYSTTVNSSGGVIRDMTVDRMDLSGGERGPVVVGLPVKGFQSAFGLIPFEASIFMEQVDGSVPMDGTPLAVADANAPAAPATTGITVGALSANTAGMNVLAPTAGASVTDFVTASAGTYFYAIASVNDAGESLVNWVGAPAGVTVAAGQQVRIRFPRVTGTGLAQARAYRVYRSTVNQKSALQFIGWIADAANQGDGTKLDFVDANGAVSSGVNADASAPSLTAQGTNPYQPGPWQNAGGATQNNNPQAPYGHNFMANTNIAVVFDRRPDNVEVAQLSPLIKWPLAVVNTTAEFLLLLYHTFIVKAPERVIIFKNIGLMP